VSEGPSGRRGAGGAVFGALLGVNFAALVLLGGVLLVLLPKMAAAYAAFGTPLPAVTGILLQVSQARAAVLMGLGLLLAGQVTLARVAGRGRHVVLLVGVLVEIVLVVAVAFAVFVPYVELINSISGSNGAGG
jgi:hypothetical protein